ncbi:MAG TPA: hypothetical protein VFU36_10905 [Jatrophihabitans sp.]|nr:hypothetical protein [Jatrophihabitans sp.]
MAHTPKYAPGSRRRHTRRIVLPLRSGRAGLLGALLLAVLALTGCVTVQLNATVHPDGTLSGTARYGVAKTLAGFVGGQDELLNQLKSQGSCDFGSTQGTTKDFDDGTYVGIECTFAGVTMAEFNSGEEGPKLSKDGKQFHLTGRMNLLQMLSDSGTGLLGGGSSSGGTPTALPSLPSGIPTDLNSLLPSGIPTDLLPSGIPTDLNSLLPSGIPTDLNSLLPSGIPTDLNSLPGLDPTSLLRTAKVSFAFTFPGKVISSKGKVSGRKVSFTPNSAGIIDFQTTASAVPANSTGLSRTSWLVLAVVLLALLAAAGVLIRRRRAAAEQPAGGYPVPGDYPLGYAYPAQQYPGAQYQGQYPTQQYPGQQYPAQQYPGQQYPAQQYPAQQYPAAPPQQYPAPQDQPYTGPPPTQPYPQQQPHPQQQPYPQQPYPQQQPYPPYQQPSPDEQYPTRPYPSEPND